MQLERGFEGIPTFSFIRGPGFLGEPLKSFLREIAEPQSKKSSVFLTQNWVTSGISVNTISRYACVAHPDDAVGFVLIFGNPDQCFDRREVKNFYVVVFTYPYVFCSKNKQDFGRIVRWFWRLYHYLCFEKSASKASGIVGKHLLHECDHVLLWWGAGKTRFIVAVGRSCRPMGDIDSGCNSPIWKRRIAKSLTEYR